MSSDSLHHQPITGAADAPSNTERRRDQFPRLVAILGGSRSGDKRDGIVHGIGVGRGIIWFAVIALVFAAWPVYKGWAIKSGSGVGYYIGMAGGIMMLLMLLYPLRKHVGWALNWGPLRYWFMLHMVFGISGPVLVLFHSTFHVKSFNAGVAFYSMLLVAVSGIVGRFIYKRIHIGLYGRKSNLAELQLAMNVIQEKVGKVGAVLLAAPGIGDKMKAFHDAAFSKDDSVYRRILNFMMLGWRRRRLTAACHLDLQRAADILGRTQGWDMQKRNRHLREVVEGVSGYLTAVQSAAQFTAYERLFRLWHILHTPFVWLLGISGIVHVIAVNMY
jgi:hypothetical protein